MAKQKKGTTGATRTTGTEWAVEKYLVEIELQERLLGTEPQRSIFAEHIATKMGKEMKKEGKSDEEIKTEIESTIEGVPEDVERGLTVFAKDKAGAFIRDYMIRGFLKEAARALKEYGTLKQLQSKVSKYLFIRPAKLYVAKPKAEVEIIERPLRAQTPQGERVAIARSESVPAGTKLTFEVHCLEGVITEGLLRTLLAYGEYQGLGQWRSGGNGRFTVTKFSKA